MPMAMGTRQELVTVPVALSFSLTPDFAQREETVFTGSNPCLLLSANGHVQALNFNRWVVIRAGAP